MHRLSCSIALITLFFCFRSVERWFEKIGRQHGSLPTSSFLHARIRPTHQQRQPTIPCSYCSWTYPTNVRRQEHDGRLRSTTRTLPHSRSHVPWTYVNEGSRWTNVERTKQELQLLRWMDPQQRQDRSLWHPTKRIEDVRHLHRKQHCYPSTYSLDLRDFLKLLSI